MPMVAVNDIEMYYEVHGEGTPLVMIMGYGGTSKDWPPNLIKNFSNHFQTIIFDNRGTGQSTTTEKPITIKQMANDIASLLDHLNIKQAHVYGISLGGMIAQEFALNHQNKVIKLVLSSTYAGGETRIVSHESREIVALVRDPPMDMPPEEIVKRYLTLMYTPEYIEKHSDSLIPWGLEYMKRTASDTRKEQWSSIMEFDAYSRLNTLRVPTLILAGLQDIWVLPENSRLIHERIVNSKLIVYPDAAHNLTLAQPQSIKDILEFLGDG
jgi:pimeloyl-ACP methyl ester carboxylesterase